MTAVLLLGVGATAASAYSQMYSGWIPATREITTRGLHSWYYAQGAQSSGGGYYVCTYMWNAHNGVIRGNVTSCLPTWSDVTFNRTSDEWYNARAVNATGSITEYLSIYATT